jgi:hypothetical protein
MAGITRCEYQGYNCDNQNLAFAHSLRRNDINTYKKRGDIDGYNEKMREVARLCGTCHAEVDANKRHVTYAIINWIINHKRKVKIK